MDTPADSTPTSDASPPDTGPAPAPTGVLADKIAELKASGATDAEIKAKIDAALDAAVAILEPEEDTRTDAEKAWDAIAEDNCVAEGEEITTGHQVDRGEARVEPFQVTRDLHFLRCDLCGKCPLPRDSFIAHVNEETNQSGETKASSFYACSKDCADDLAGGRIVEKALEQMVSGDGN